MPSIKSVSAALGLVSASPSTIANDGIETSEILVTVRWSDGTPAVGVDAGKVVLTSTGTNNTIVQPTGVTDASGRITGTIASTTLETKTITATIAGLAVTQTASVVISGTPALYPNQVGATLETFDGTVRGTTDAFGITAFSGWTIDTSPAPPAGNLAVVTDLENPVGTDESLQFTFNNLYEPRCAEATATIGTGSYSQFYFGCFLAFDDAFAPKIIYVGAPLTTSGAELYLTRTQNGRLTVQSQGGPPAFVVIDTGSNVIPTLGQYYLVEMYLIAESSLNAGDGYCRLYVDGVAVGTNNAVNWGATAFGQVEWYATINSLPTSDDHVYRIGGFRFAGVA